MEFPYLGKNCTKKDCNLLDFLPFKCNACELIFCKDHFYYEKHECNKAYQLDNQVPVCPLCNQPVPTKKNELLDIRMNEHIEQECADIKAKKKNEIYTNKCFFKNCKGKEIMPLICQNCSQNFCLKHRHLSDHKCLDKLKLEKIKTNSNSLPFIPNTNNKINYLKNNLQSFSSSISSKIGYLFSNSSVESCESHFKNIEKFQGNLTESEAFKFAINESLNLEKKNLSKSQKEIDKNLDLDLKKAIELSQNNFEKNKKNCLIN